MGTANLTIQLRRDVAAAWTANNPILASGEIGIETNTIKIKIGNGVTTWNALPYYSLLGVFTDLGDTPNSYVGEGGKFVAVKATEDGLEFQTIVTVESDPVFDAWLSGPPNLSEFTNDSGYLTAEADTLDSVCDRGNTTNQSIEVNELTIGGKLTGISGFSLRPAVDSGTAINLSRAGFGDPVLSVDTSSGIIKILGQLAIIESGVSPSKYTYFQGGDQTVDITYTLPTALPPSNKFLQCTDAGIWSWEDVPAGHDAITLDANVDTLLSLSTQELGLDVQSANLVFAGPDAGAAAIPTFRALVAADIPDLSGTYLTDITGESIFDLSDFPADPGSDKYLMWDDSESELVWADAGGGVDEFIELTDCPAAYSSAGDLLRINATNDGLEFFTPSYLTSVTSHDLLSATHGDTTASSVARGDLITGQGATPKWDNLAIGTIGQVLTSDGTDIYWAAAPGVTDHGALSGLSDNDHNQYLLTDCSNDPLTGNLEISKADPEIRLTDTGNSQYTRLLLSDTSNKAIRYNIVNTPAMDATGGTKTTLGSYYLHTFTSSGSFIVTGSGNVEVLVVAGGGGGAGGYATDAQDGGGGAGGLLYSASYAVTAGTYAVTVGAKGTKGSGAQAGSNGGNSVFGTMTAVGGGGGGTVAVGNAGNGGCGGGESEDAGYSSPGTGSQGGNGGSGTTYYSNNRGAAGGGGGMGGNGGNGSESGAGTGTGGAGGAGVTYTITGSTVWYCEGGGGAGAITGGSTSHGGGRGSDGEENADNATGYGCGGGGAGVIGAGTTNGGDGYQGIVIIKYLVSGTDLETVVWSSEDGVNSGEKGIQTFGDVSGRTVIDGINTRFNLGGVEKIQLASTGLNFIDSFPINFGNANDASITFDSNSLNIASNLVTASDSLELIGGTNGVLLKVGSTAQHTITSLTDTLADGLNFVVGTTTGTKIGTATGQKLGFWNATPVVQQVLATGAGRTVDEVITFLQTIGLCKQS